MPGSRSRRKGRRAELEIVHLHEAAGIPCRRRQAAGEPRGPDDPDLLVADVLYAEVKARKGGKGFALLERWLGDGDLLFLRRDRGEPLVVMPWPLYASMCCKWLMP
jgi:Holliday junction resolvase